MPLSLCLLSKYYGILRGPHPVSEYLDSIPGSASWVQLLANAAPWEAAVMAELPETLTLMWET